MSETTQINNNNIDPAQKKRHRPGKCARRRKRKAQAILDAAAAATSGGHVEAGVEGTTATTAVPSDRGYTLEGVKVRRREERRKRRCTVTHHVAADGSSLEEAHHDDVVVETKEDDDASSLLDPKDEVALQSQLGFIPGNAVCVAARLSKELSMNTSNQEDSPPSVVKLYPMVVRESYHGGKSDGRAFKGRRRGGMRVEDKMKDDDSGGATGSKGDCEDDHDQKASEVGTASSDNHATTDECKNERAWVVEPSSNVDKSTDKVNDGDTTTNNNNQQERHPEQQPDPPRQIIEPFPTLYWLTSPLLRTQISKLEISKDHNVPTMEKRLRSSPSNLRQMERAHKSYGTKRWELLTPEDQTNILSRGWKAALDDTRGVAGIRLKNGRYDCVKCLHAHAAHYLAQVAEWAVEREDGGSVGLQQEEVETAKIEGVVASRECDRDDLNLVGKWTMEAVVDSVMKSAGSK
mmetsp:Transcript_20644/g.44844  ORF Transcript_20644/g.44844 Transcript_20644/m.44844 type:complete len:463 (-) Transcript_20644:147-1535(-)|eukprot:CAMPEP_0172313782 /NCGR_PEP_ID=MMETSP1058-20130122/20944_1 /TAXON_ID=83371 /ORGANISM="Detonula confervacea, Strain CCMP 353" /LENGTH=462 /DNA_ID=CAMNT_0013027491 /DNA_START=75 /DNA_END=1463 /DNA_ORIENTATION=-